MLWQRGRRGPAATARRGGRREVSEPGRSLQVSLVCSPRVRGCTELHGFLARPTPALGLCRNNRSGTMDTAAEAASGGEVATATARPATARTNVPVPTKATPRRHDSAEGCRARRARARARGTVGRAPAKAEATVWPGGEVRAA